MGTGTGRPPSHTFRTKIVIVFSLYLEDVYSWLDLPASRLGSAI